MDADKADNHKLKDNQELEKKNQNLFTRVVEILEQARTNVIRTVNSQMVIAFWLTGREIVEEEQHGEVRAEYGKRILEDLAHYLTDRYGKGFSVANLRNFRQFYLTYSNRVPEICYPTSSELPQREKRYTLCSESEVSESEVSESEVVGLAEGACFHVESKLEEALITHLQEFLLELGNGFAFIGRQKRLTLDGDHFYPDLVFYHVKLKCYAIIDLKVAKLSPQDLGQMQMYVHYYDREIREPGDNPTIGLILCTDKNDAVVQYVLDEENQQIFASRYRFVLPDEKELAAELMREMGLLSDEGSEEGAKKGDGKKEGAKAERARKKGGNPE